MTQQSLATQPTTPQPLPRKIEVSWDDAFGGAFPESPTRRTFREAVETVAAKARASLPENHGRIEKAVQLVLAGDVEQLPDSTARVTSQSNGTTQYYIVNGTCECPDAPRAPEGFCKHRLAAGIYKRAFTLATQRLDAVLDDSQPQADTPTTSAVSLPEAPASVNCYVIIAGRQAQVTLRDANEARLLARLEALLARFPVDTDTTPRAEGWCVRHQTQMQRHTNAKGSWWSHKTPDGWCRGT
jgi:hypothetical protein